MWAIYCAPQTSTRLLHIALPLIKYLSSYYILTDLFEIFTKFREHIPISNLPILIKKNSNSIAIGYILKR